MAPLMYAEGISVFQSKVMCPPPPLKRCPGCPPEMALQPAENFDICRRKADGLQVYCRTCQTARTLASRNPERYRAYMRAYMRGYRARQQKPEQ